jgi:hypothetical protein
MPTDLTPPIADLIGLAACPGPLDVLAQPTMEAGVSAGVAMARAYRTAYLAAVSLAATQRAEIRRLSLRLADARDENRRLRAGRAA